MKILITSEFSTKGMEQLRVWFNAEIIYKPWTENGKGLNPQELINLINAEGAEALITELEDVNREVLDKCSFLKFIGDCRGNPTNIDMAAAKEKGIPVFCTPGRNSQAVAELLVGGLISFYRNLIQSANYCKEGKWDSPPPSTYYKFQGNEICEKLIGFVGFGAIGRKAAEILSAFGARILYYDPFVQCRFEKASLEEIFSRCDVVSIHLPVLKDTKGIINKRLLKLMKKDSIFINTARSALVDTEVLYDMLEKREIRGAILDVFDNEPPSERDYEIIKLQNVIATPHICGATFEVVDHQSEILNAQIKKHFSL